MTCQIDQNRLTRIISYNYHVQKRDSVQYLFINKLLNPTSEVLKTIQNPTNQLPLSSLVSSGIPNSDTMCGPQLLIIDKKFLSKPNNGTSYFRRR